MAKPSNPRIHLVCFVGDSDVALLPHLVSHYRDLGVESFYIIRHAEAVDSSGYALIESAAESSGVSLFHTHVGPWSLELNQRLVRFAMNMNPQDWYIVADSDEFQVYDRPIPDLIERCESLGASHVNGCFLDRVGPDGTFPEVSQDPLWSQFPLAGSISAGLLRALPLKVGLARGHVGLGTGQHGTAHGRALPASESFIQVHHLKWSSSVVERVEDRIKRFARMGDDSSYSAVIEESHRFLSHIRANGGRIDVSDRRFRLHECGSGYSEHPQWDSIIREALRWKWAIV